MQDIINHAFAAADGLSPELAALAVELVDTWERHRAKNELREEYYNGHIPAKDLGITVSPDIARKLKPSIDWAAKAVNWWADRVQFQGFTSNDEEIEQALASYVRLNDLDNLTHKVVSSALKTSPAFITVTQGAEEKGEPGVVFSGYPATAATAIYNDAKKRIDAGLVVAATRRNKLTGKREPLSAVLFTDTDVTTINLTADGWKAETKPHNMGRVPMEPIAYHATLERPFGTSRITRTVRGLVDDAQRELMNMTVVAAFAAAPQKYFLGADAAQARKVAEQPFGAFVGSIFAATPNSKGQVPQFGQLPQLTMQPHSDYMRLLGSLFSDATGVPLSSLGFSTTNPSSAEAIRASKEDAIIDITSFVASVRRSYVNVATMALAIEFGMSFADAASTYEVGAVFADPATPSPDSATTRVKEQIAAFPWMAESQTMVGQLGYSADVSAKLVNDMKRAQAREAVQAAANSAGLNLTGGTDD